MNGDVYTSPLGEEGVDVSESFEDGERLMEARFITVQRDHHSSLEGQVR